jgi:hypothetical protein
MPADSIAEVETHRLPTAIPPQHHGSGIKSGMGTVTPRQMPTDSIAEVEPHHLPTVSLLNTMHLV